MKVPIHGTKNVLILILLLLLEWIAKIYDIIMYVCRFWSEFTKNVVISNITIFFFLALITFILGKVTNKEKAWTSQSYVRNLGKLVTMERKVWDKLCLKWWHWHNDMIIKEGDYELWGFDE